MISLMSFTPAAHAAASTGTITITPTTGTPSYACNDGICDFATLVTVTGTGFPSGQDSIDLCFVSTTSTAAIGCTNGIDLGINSLFDQSIACSVCNEPSDVQADANGNFKVQFYAPIAYGGTYNVYAYYTPSSGVPAMTPVTVFTLTAAMAIEDQATFTNSGIPGQPFDVIVVGMGAASPSAGEGVQLIPSSFFAGTWSGLTVGSTLGQNQGVFEEDAGTLVTSGSLVTTHTLSAVGLTTTVIFLTPVPLAAGLYVGDYVAFYYGTALAGQTELITNSPAAVGCTFLAPCTETLTTHAFTAATGPIGASFAISTSNAGVSIGAATLPTLPSGSTTVEALGLTTGTIATTTFTTTPSIILGSYTTPTCAASVSILSIPTAAGNKFCMSGVGFAKSSTIAAEGSVTVGGASTIESNIITSSTGTFGPVPITLSSATSVGPLTISFDGMNFNWANANIESPGILLGSNVGQGALTYMSETTGHVGDTVYVFGFGYTQNAGCSPTNLGACITGFLTPEFDFNGVLATNATGNLIVPEDSNGAFETSFSVPALPTTTPACVAATATCYSVSDLTGTFGAAIISSTSTAGTTASTIFDSTNPFVAGDVGDYLMFTAGPAAGQMSQITALTNAGEVTVSPPFSVAPGLNTYTVSKLTTNANTAPTQTFTINPEATFGFVIGSTVGIESSFGFTPVLTISGFANTPGDNTVTVTMNGVTWKTLNGIDALDGGIGTFALAQIGGTPATDFPGGSYTVNASGTTKGNWAVTTNTITILPMQAEANDGGAISALSINYGNAGESVALLSSPAGGLHGLAPSTAFTIMWDGTTQVGSFTSTATGEVPVGVSFTVPAGTAGFHIVDIQKAGASVIYGNQLTFGQQFGGCLNACDLIFHLLPLLTATPSLVGATQTATVVGNGLPSNTLLYVVAPNQVSYASFTSTSTGAVPSGTTFTVPAQPTYVSCGVNCYAKGGELGTLITWAINNAQSQPVGVLQFVYGTVASLSASSGSAGSSVTITANGLNAPVSLPDTVSSNSPYDVVFNCVPSAILPNTCAGLSSGATPANIIIGALIPNALGAASTTITIPPSATAGTYVIQLVSTVAGTWDLAIPVTFTVGAPSGVGVTTLTPGSPTQSTLNGQADVQLTYTNTLTSSSINAIGYAVVTNGLGQVVLYTTSETTLPASGSQTLYFVLAGLPAASYTVTVYAISSTGLVVSQTTTSTVVIS